MNQDDDGEVPRRPGYLYDPAAPLPEHLKPKAEAPPPKHRLRDVDSVGRAFRIRAIAFGGWLGILGMFVGMLISQRYGTNPLITVPVGLLAGTGLAAGLGLFVSGRAGALGARLFMPGGSSTPPTRQYSLAESLAARGRYAEAVAEYEGAAASNPHDPAPCLRLARLLRESLGRPEDAVRWFRAAITRRDCDQAMHALAVREIVEIYTHRLRAPERALPDLAVSPTATPARPPASGQHGKSST